MASSQEVKQSKRNVLIVKFKNSLQIELLHGDSVIFSDKNLDNQLRNIGVRKIKPMHRNRPVKNKIPNKNGEAYRLILKRNISKKEAIISLGKMEMIDHVEQSRIRTVDGITPNDPSFGLQWGLKNNAGPDIAMELAWELTTGHSDVVVAFIDTGLKLDHPEFTGRIWTNTGEIAGNNIDDDANGYIDDVNGYDFYNDDNDATGAHYHGTAVAGILAANGDNNSLIAGIDWHCTIMPMRVTADDGNGNTDVAAEAIYYAVDNGADVINISMSGSGESLVEKDAIAYAVANNVVVIASMGNHGTNEVVYPAGFEDVIAVGAQISSGNWWPNSAHGQHIDLTAPGANIKTITNNNDATVLTGSGTSFSAPMVSGVVTLIKSINPSLSVDSIRAILSASAVDKVGEAEKDMPGWDAYFGQGMLNAYNALRYVVPTDTILYRAACASYDFLGTELTSSGTYYDTIPNHLGADSILTLSLLIAYDAVYNQELTVLDSYDFNTDILTSSGDYQSTFMSQYACDSLVNLALTVIPNSTCLAAIDLTAPDLSLDYTFTVNHTLSDVFYTYTVPADGYLRMSSTGNSDPYLKVYGETCGNLIDEQDDEGGGDFNVNWDSFVTAGQTFIFQWDDVNITGNWDRIFDAMLFFSEDSPGQTCANPLTLVAGINTYQHTGGSRYYEFIAPSNGKLEAGTCGDESQGEQEGKFSIWAACSGVKLAQGNGCDYDPDEYYWEYVMYNDLVAGEQYILKINPDWTSSDYPFTVAFTEVEEPGTSCNTPININADYPIAGNGYAVINVDNSAGNHFFEYTATAKGTIRMTSCYASSDTYLRVYETNCGNLIYEADNAGSCSGGTEFTHDVQNGQKFIFEWSNQKEGGQFDARLYYHRNVAAETCDQAIALTAGTNTHNNWFGSQFRTYTAALAGTLNLSTCNGQADVTIDIFDACDGTRVASSEHFVCPDDLNNIERWAFVDYAIAAGESVVIEVGEGHESNFDFQVEFTPNGQSCTSPVHIAATGLYPVNHTTGISWFDYTAEKEGQLVILTCGLGNDNDTEISIYTDCAHAAIAASDDYCGQESKIELSVTQGTNYQLHWSDTQIDIDGSSGRYDFEIIYLEDIAGKDKADAILVTEGAYKTDTRVIGEQWFKYLLPSSGELKVSGCHPDNILDEVVLLTTEATGDIAYKCIVNNMAKIGTYTGEAGDEIFIKWSGTTQADIPFSIAFEATPCVQYKEVEVAATFTVDNSAGHDYFRFLPLSSGTAVVSSCRAGLDTRIFAWDEFCGNVYRSGDGPATCGYGSMIKFPVVQGEYYYVQFRNDETDAIYEADLFMQEEKPGYSFENPIPLDLNCENKLNNDHGLDTFYAFEMPTDGDLSFSTCASGDWANYQTYSSSRTTSFGSDCGDEKWTTIIHDGQAGDQYIFKYFQYNDAVGLSNLTLDPVDETWVSPTLDIVNEAIFTCNNYTFAGQELTASGDYSNLFIGATGCDSLVNLSLTILESTSGALAVNSCNSYTWEGSIYTASGTFQQTLNNAAGCDSLATLTLVINHPTSSILTETACDSYDFLGTLLSATGSYNETLTNAVGCDSLVTLDLTITNSTSSELTASACDSYDFLGTILSTSGTYNNVLTNSLGCDSLVTLNLTVNSSSATKITETTCDSYDFNGTLLTTSGIYVDQVSNASGCDQEITLELTINASSESTLTETACDTYDFLGTLLTATGTYHETLTNTVGCDSLVTLDLTIKESTTSTLTETACDTYEFLGTLLTATGTYHETLTNTVGCDSLVTLNLTINEAPIATVSQNGAVLFADELDGATYQWLDCDHGNEPIEGATKRQLTPPRSGNYAVAVSKDNCTSTSDCVLFDWVLGTAGPDQATLRVYPTITSGELLLNTNQALDRVQVVISSLNGTIVYYEQLPSLTNRHRLYIDAANGIYLIQVISDDQLISSQRIIKRN
jgi:subtilisin family serine protease